MLSLAIFLDIFLRVVVDTIETHVSEVMYFVLDADLVLMFCYFKT